MSRLISLNQRKTQQLDDEEAKVASFIMDNANTDYDKKLKGAPWELFYHMSSFREGILNWYPFSENCSILELSDGFGALTGLLSRVSKEVIVLEENEIKAECIAKRYADLENLTIFTSYDRKMPLEEQYEYIVIEKPINTLYEMEKMLQQVWPYLKETGRLLFVCENRFGMKYWCGVPDPINHKPFYGIRGRNRSGMMNRQELIDVLEKSSKITEWKLYYPFPDHKLPQAVYTDSNLPHDSVKDRIIPYYTENEQKSLICLESEICDELIHNGLFNIFANSFLVECSKSSFIQEVHQVALSTDRGKEHGFATIILANDKVRKKNLYPEGRKCLEILHNNQQELMQRGTLCVEEILHNNFIEMPFIKKKTLIEHLKHLFIYQKEQVESIFDLLYTLILSSSDSVKFDECKLKDYRVNEESAGTILRKAYIDMIPYNCFFDDGNIIFYDQEFVKECYPAKYVLFRALRYTYIYVTQAEDIIPIIYFKKKYNLQEVWQAFEEEEARFVEENRNYERLNSFYGWASIPPAMVDKNIEHLLQIENVEKINPVTITKPFCRHRYDLEKYRLDDRMNAIKKVQLNLLKKLSDVCEKNNLSYCVFYGTLLGAVRHKGFVPWDDDVDVLMVREDYDKLLTMPQEAFGDVYFLQTPENDSECFYGGYSKLRDESTTGIEKRNEGKNCNQGIWIDILPLDMVHPKKEVFEKQQKEILFYQRLLLKKTYPDKRMLWEMDEQKEQYYEEISELFSREILCQRLYDAMTYGWKTDYDLDENSQVAILARYWGRNECKRYRASDFEYLVKKKFEDMEVYVPIGYENCLADEYGQDFAIYPEEDRRVPHHGAIYDTTQSYIDYMKKNK